MKTSLTFAFIHVCSQDQADATAKSNTENLTH